MKYIKSPLNYTGNKYRLLNQITPFFPKNINVMVDLFCGGATVGLNTRCKKVIFIDNEPRVINLLQYLATCNIDYLIFELIQLVENYGLSCSYKYGYDYYKKQICDSNPNNGLKSYNLEGYYKLRLDYNSLVDKNSILANKMLYLLIVYGFNNDLRFSKEGNFNLPVGKTDLNTSNVSKLKEYILRVNMIQAEFICADFNSNTVKKILKIADFVYIDPPYLITNAVYNEANKWNEKKEEELISLLDFLINNHKFFVLSNVLEKENIRNEPLFSWMLKRKNSIKVIDIDYHYRSASYNKRNRNANEREVIIYASGAEDSD